MKGPYDYLSVIYETVYLFLAELTMIGPYGYLSVIDWPLLPVSDSAKKKTILNFAMLSSIHITDSCFHHNIVLILN